MGSAARWAIRSSDLVEAGFTGSPTSLESSFGKIAGELVNPSALTAPLDYAHLGLTRNYFKIHSACALSHAAIDAVMKLPAFDADDISQIHVETVSNNLKLNRQSEPNALSARFSLPYVVAAAALRRPLDADGFRFEAKTARLAERVDVKVTDDLEAKWPDDSPARITFVTSDGKRHTTQVDNPHGHYHDPLSGEEVRQKFESLVGHHGTAQAWWKRLTSLSRITDCSQLFSESVDHAS